MLSLTLPIKSMNPLRKRIYCRHLYRSAESFLQRESWSTTKENSKFILVEDKTRPGSVVVFKARNSLSLFANCYLQILKISYTEFHKTKYWSHYFSYNTYIYIYIYIYDQSVYSSCFALWELISTSVQLRSKEDLEGPECLNYCQSCKRCISFVATLLDQQSAQLN